MSSMDIIMAGAGSGGSVGTKWNPRYGRATTRCGVYSSLLGKFVVGGDGMILLSSTGTSNWEVATTTLPSIIYGLAASSSVVVAVGTTNSTFYSTDGYTWTQVTVSGVFYCVTFGASLFVMCDSLGKIYSSPDGITWTYRATPTGNYFLAVTYSTALSLYVAVGQNGNIATSPDGITWTPQASGTASTLRSVAANGSFIVAGDSSGSIHYSSNGTSWTTVTTPLSVAIVGLTWNGTNFCAVPTTGSTPIISSNATTWTSTGSFPLSMTAQWLASSPTTTVAGSTPSMISYSGSLAAWAYSGSGNFSGYGCVGSIYANGRYVVCGAYSTTGMVAYGTDPYSLSINTSFPNVMRSVAYGAGLYVVVGGAGNVYTSPDCVTWTARTSGVAVQLNGVTYATGAFVAVGNSGTVILSTDGITWTTQTSGTAASLTAIVWTGTKFIACANGATNCITSTNGSTWASGGVVNIGTTNAITYGNGKAVIAGLNATAVSSDQGVSWTATSTSLSATSVTYSFGLFTLSTFSGGFYSSTDGATWSIVGSAFFAGNGLSDPQTLLFDGNMLVAYGDKLAIYASPPPPTITL